ncbi:hypothetical protein BDA96_02G259900 [Sorghum bicolor]|uniref:Uncharacterized protein n=2 Tax=Sorghum bicolor TaxID=4558 RepID=A0A921UU39_SORBI|nr:hypothetical protein SORBI_3002G248500 [Sorghum bicolor]KAG0544258.1 hypothetical protein BDA96_02G259900 [Sorghum bicolor]
MHLCTTYLDHRTKKPHYGKTDMPENAFGYTKLSARRGRDRQMLKSCLCAIAWCFLCSRLEVT